MPIKDRLKPRKIPTQQRAKETMDVILDAAAQVFEANGYAKSTTNLIARRAGVSVGSLYQYFPNKDAIALKLLERHLEDGTAFLNGMLDDLRRNGRIDRAFWIRHLEALLALHEKNPRLHQVLFEEIPSLSQLVAARVEDVYTPYAERLMEVLRECGPTSRPDLPIAVRIIIQTTESLTHWYVMHGTNQMPRDRFIEESADLVANYMYIP